MPISISPVSEKCNSKPWKTNTPRKRFYTPGNTRTSYPLALCPSLMFVYFYGFSSFPACPPLLFSTVFSPLRFSLPTVRNLENLRKRSSQPYSFVGSVENAINHLRNPGGISVLSSSNLTFLHNLSTWRGGIHSAEEH